MPNIKTAHHGGNVETRLPPNTYNQMSWGTHMGNKGGLKNVKAEQRSSKVSRHQRRIHKRLELRTAMWQDTQNDKSITETQRRADKLPGSNRKH